MSDTYQAVYDAVRSRFGGCDVSEAIRSATHLDASWQIEYVKQEACAAIMDVREQMTRPAVVYKPRIGIDGNQWIAVYGDNIQEGVAGCGDSPELAMADFDKAWKEKLGGDNDNS